MNKDMPDSPLNEPEHGLQHPFRKSWLFNGLLMALTVLAVYLPIRELPDRRQLPVRVIALNFQPIALSAVAPFRLAGAWVMTADDPRFSGLSALAMADGRFIAISDLGAVVRFDRPSSGQPRVKISDLDEGPGPAGWKTSRDAESLVRDPRGRGWWIGYEQRHSLWLYDKGFANARAAIVLDRPDWWRNRGIEGLLTKGDGLLALAENGREAVQVTRAGLQWMKLVAGADIADATTAPDGSAWVLLRSKSIGGITQAIAPLVRSGTGYRAGKALLLPKGAFDNFEGMAISERPGGGWRFWLVTDDGHRFEARTLLVALDLPKPGKANARRISPGASYANSPDR
jgi:hypothetical protein